MYLEQGDPRDEPLAWQVHNIEAEQALLGCILVNNEAHRLASNHVTHEHFYEPLHRSIFGAMTQLIEAGKIVDFKLLKSFIPNELVAPEMTVSQYLARLAAEATTIINAPDYARIIRELADRRRLAEIGNALQPVDASHPVGLATEAISALDEIIAANTAETGAPSLTMPQAVVRAVDAAAKAYQMDGRVIGIPTTFRDLDEKLGGMSEGDFVVLAGRPGMGKSAMILTLLRRAAAKGYISKFVSLEMGDISLMHRLISDQIYDMGGDRLPYAHIRNGRFHEKMFERITEAGKMLADLPIHIEQQPGLTMSQISARARQMKRKGGLHILAIDHLDLIKPTGRYQGNKVYELGEITAAGKALAKELGIVVIMLAQLSREVEKREDKRPVLSDLRSSGSIEQDADTVIFLYRKSYYLAMNEPTPGTEDHAKWQVECEKHHNMLQAIVAKQRMGPTGPVDLFCDIGNNAVRDLEGAR